MDEFLIFSEISACFALVFTIKQCLIRKPKSHRLASLKTITIYL